jgi:hypothetical protein
LVILIIIVKECKLWSSSLCSFLHFTLFGHRYSSQHPVLKHR